MRKSNRFSRPPIASDFPLPPAGGGGGGYSSTDYAFIVFTITLVFTIGTIIYYTLSSKNASISAQDNELHARQTQENLEALCEKLSNQFPNEETKLICEHLNNYYIDGPPSDCSIAVLDIVTKT